MVLYVEHSLVPEVHGVINQCREAKSRYVEIVPAN